MLDPSLDKIIAKYDHVFQGIGKITDKRNNREICEQLGDSMVTHVTF
jgi:hypothetical protein